MSQAFLLQSLDRAKQWVQPSLFRDLLLEGILAAVSLAAVANTNALGLVATANAPDIVPIDFESARLVAVARTETSAVLLAVAILIRIGASARVSSNGHLDVVMYRFLYIFCVQSVDR